MHQNTPNDNHNIHFGPPEYPGGASGAQNLKIAVPGGLFERSDMGSFELLSYLCSLNTILAVQIENFDFDGLLHTHTIAYYGP